jgi:hypothetical protein
MGIMSTQILPAHWVVLAAAGAQADSYSDERGTTEISTGGTSRYRPDRRSETSSIDQSILVNAMHIGMLRTDA